MAYLSPPSFEPIRPTKNTILDAPRLNALVAASTSLVPQPTATIQVVSSRQRCRRQTKIKPMSSSERGIKFRQRQQEREMTLLTDMEKLQREVLRLQALRDVYEGKSLSSVVTAAPMRFIMDYFNQFRIGLRVPGAPTNVLDSETQRSFLSAWIEPHTQFGNRPAADMILDVWERYSRFHTSVNLVLESAEIITADACSSVIVRGVLNLRYSRRTIQNVFPNAIAEEDLIQKLISRQLHVHYRAQMHFNDRAKLEGYEIEPDFVGALVEILGNLKDCERILGRALIKGHVLGEELEPAVEGVEPVEILASPDVESEPPPSMCNIIEDVQPHFSCSHAMALDYILS